MHTGRYLITTLAVTLVVALTCGCGGSSSTPTAPVVVPPANTAPTATITAPGPGLTFTYGRDLTLSGTGTDTEDGTIPPADMSWASNMDGSLGTGTTLDPAALSIGPHTITLTVEDSEGLTDADTVSLTIQGLRIITRGGAGADGNGGSGGDFDFDNDSGANMEVRGSGLVDTTFTVPTVNPELGINPRTISADTTLTPDGSNRILGDDGVTDATGLHVLSGVTLTLLGNQDTDGVGATMERAQIRVDTTFLIEGTLTGYADQTATGDGLSRDGLELYLDADNLVVRSTGRVMLRGKDAPAGSDGGDGGYFDMHMDYGVICQGPVLTRGGDGDNGGEGGYVDFHACEYGHLYLTGDVDASGGTGLNGVGGDGGWFYADTDDAALFCSADITTRGGDGTLGGGDADDIEFYVCCMGSSVVSGDLDSSGGNATVNGHGGDADYIEMYYYGGPVRMSGDYLARGGNGAGAAGDGGDGDDFEIYGYDDYSADGYHGYGFQLAANIDLRGGAGRNGGNGGDVYLEAEFDESHNPLDPRSQDCLLLGYDLLDLQGGRGSVDGGSGGDLDFYLDYGGNDDAYYIGSILNEAEIITRGGEGVAGNGGSGGDVDLETEYSSYPYFDRMVSNTAPIDMSGGSGPLGGGDAGDLWFYDYGHIESSGSILANGGGSVTGPGGEGGYIEMATDDILNHTGAITANGGASNSGIGGDADDMWIWSRETSVRGNLTACGGASGTAAGGDSAEIWVGGTAMPSVYVGTCDVAQAPGTPPGAIGEVWIDGINCALTGGVVTLP